MTEIVRPDWGRVKAWAESELAQLRKELESPNCLWDSTVLKRGEIRALTRLLDLPTTLAAQAPSNVPPGWPASTQV